MVLDRNLWIFPMSKIAQSLEHTRLAIEFLGKKQFTGLDTLEWSLCGAFTMLAYTSGLLFTQIN